MLVGCSKSDNANNESLGILSEEIDDEDFDIEDSAGQVSSYDSTTDSNQKPIRPTWTRDELAPNELGEVMVLAYGAFGFVEEKGIYSFDSFREDLELLYSNGYRLVSMDNFLAGNIDLEAGLSPVVLTFDGAYEGQFRVILSEGRRKVDPNSALGILIEFSNANPDFGLEATFYVSGEVPFGQPEYLKFKLEFLASNGFMIGNGTHSGESIARLSALEIRREVALGAALVADNVFRYITNSLALPNGEWPDQELHNYLTNGEHERFVYENYSIMSYGMKPYYSPYCKYFNMQDIQRILVGGNLRGSNLKEWINYFNLPLSNRYISDGNPKIITVPRAYLNLICPLIETEMEVVILD